MRLMVGMSLRGLLVATSPLKAIGSVARTAGLTMATSVATSVTNGLGATIATMGAEMTVPLERKRANGSFATFAITTRGVAGFKMGVVAWTTRMGEQTGPVAGACGALHVT